MLSGNSVGAVSTKLKIKMDTFSSKKKFDTVKTGVFPSVVNYQIPKLASHVRFIPICDSKEPRKLFLNIQLYGNQSSAG